jgi:DNA mismatch endonuclease (patch repair protein)
MRGNRRAGTAPEVLLRQALDRQGLQYRTNVDDLPGVPDIVISDHLLAVFCDGDFWHGRAWHTLRGQLMRRSNAEYWIAKIDTNRSRDRRTRRLLQEHGWAVVRYWESDIRKNPARVAERIARYVVQAETTPRRPVNRKSSVST